MEINKFSAAAAAYRDATRVAEKIVEETGSGTASPASVDAPMKPSFSELMSNSLDESRDSGYKSEMLSTKAIAKEADMHDMIAAVSNAELTLNAVVAVRDRVIGAYNDIIKMPI